MIRSMTGFGKASHSENGLAISVEMSSVNHRFLDASVRLPPEWSTLDPDIREVLKNRLSRGKISLTVNRKRGPGAAQSLSLDEEIAKQYIMAANKLGHLIGHSEPLSVNTLATLHGVFCYEDDSEGLEDEYKLVLKTIDEAVSRLESMRGVEGLTLAKDLAERVNLIREALAEIEERLPQLNTAYEERIRTRIQELNTDSSVAEERIAVEIALLAEKGDVTEETVRLKAHLDHADDLLEAGEPVGRKLNFLAQEIQREINTLGSKVRDSDVSRSVILMKSELEKIREQVQNIE